MTRKQYAAKMRKRAASSDKKPIHVQDMRWPVIYGIKPTMRSGVWYGEAWSGDGHADKDGWQLAIQLDTDDCGDLFADVSLDNDRKDEIEDIGEVLLHTGKRGAVEFVKLALGEWMGVR